VSLYRKTIFGVIYFITCTILYTCQFCNIDDVLNMFNNTSHLGRDVLGQHVGGLGGHHIGKDDI